jgi:hypothetical protein
MKKALVMVIFIFILSLSTFANAAITSRKLMNMTGEFIEFIPFSFTVPSGNCNNVRTFEYEQGYYYPTYSDAHWQELAPGTQVKSYSAGIFKFIVDGSTCNPEIVLEGEVNDLDLYGVWSGLDIRSKDVSLFVKGVGVARDYYYLPSSGYVYTLVFSPYGQKYGLDRLVKDADSGSFGIQPAGSKLVGAIISDDRGYLQRPIFFPWNTDTSAMWLKSQAKNIILYDDQPVVLIYKYQ